MSKASKQMSEIDRLIDLASKERGSSQVIEAIPPALETPSNSSLSLEDQKDPQPSMWRVLIQLRVLLPYLSRLLPLVERGLLGTGGSRAEASVDTTHFDQGIAGVESTHRDLSSQLKNQTSEIKYLQEQITWLSKSLETETLRQEQIVESLASMKKLVQVWSIVVVSLLVVLIGAVVFSVLQHQ